MDTNKFLVMSWEWIEDSLSDEEIEALYGLLDKASSDKPETNYIVVDSSEPYAEKVLELQKSKAPVLTKAEALRVLEELTGADPELAHIEADEALINYINDKEIEKAFDEVPKWYA